MTLRPAAFVAAELAVARTLEVLGDRLFAAVQDGSSIVDPEGPATDVDLHLIVTSRAALPEEDRVRLVEALAAAEREGGVEHDVWVLALDDLEDDRPPHLLRPAERNEAWALHRRHWLAGRCRLLHGPSPETWTHLPTREATQRALEAELAYCIRAAEQLDRADWPLRVSYLVRQGCRLLASATGGEVVLSKGEACAWARAALPGRWTAIIDAAEALAAGASEADLRAEDALEFLAFVRTSLGWTPRLEILGIRGVPEVTDGDDVGALLAAYATFEDRDVVVVAQKIVSKAEGRILAVSQPEAVAAETRRIVARRGEIVITETRHGFVCANAGVDRSNAPGDACVLLPEDPDASAERIRRTIEERSGARVGVIVSDTFGRPWRNGQVNVALGVAGLAPLRDLRGSPDRNGRIMESSVQADADELASAAELVMGKAEGVPAAIVRGLWTLGPAGSGRDLIRPAAEDLFPTGIGGEAPVSDGL